MKALPFFLLFFFTACLSESFTPPDIRPKIPQTVRSAFPFTMLEISGNNPASVLLREGSQLVFKYSDREEDQTATIMFEIDRNAREFYSNNMVELKAVYGSQEGEGATQYVRIFTGSVSGKKIDDQSWDISFNIKFQDDSQEWYVNPVFIRSCSQ